MKFFGGSLFPENQQKLVITVAPYGPEWMPADFPEDIPVTMESHIQKAVDCYNAGATVLHLHVRELDGTGSKRLSKFNELLAGIRARVPELILQVGGSISFAPEKEGDVAKWLSDDTRHLLAELQPIPDQVTIAINTNQMNVVEQMCPADLAGTSMAEPQMYRAYREMTIPAGPEWVEEHIRRLSTKGIQTHFQLANIAQLETVERMMRRGVANVPLILTWVAIGGGFEAPNIYNLSNFVRACPDGAVLTLETSMLNVLPINMMAIAMGLHVRCGIEDNLWTQRRDRKMTSVEQIEQLVRISREFGRDVANCQEAREIYKIGTFYGSADETLAANGFAPNRKYGQVGFTQHVASGVKQVQPTRKAVAR
ncbi:MAG: 3-keto-5-aminohexanoate cleavage protein [Steroidobacteraceae bacterium]